MGKLVLFGHGGSGNHGCEAIVRSTAAMLPGRELMLISRRPEEDLRWGIPALAERGRVNRCPVDFLRAYAALKLRGDWLAMEELACREAFSHISPGDAALSVGGDNYCYRDNPVQALLHRLAKGQGAKTVLWGCSVEPEAVRDPATARDLARYDLICARESISFEALGQVNPNTVQAADPAFCLEPAPTALPGGFLPGNTVGINLSPLVMERERVSGLVFENYVNLIGAILEETDLHIALIPHVTWAFSDDRIPLGRLYGSFRDRGRVSLVSERSCRELKAVIAQCRFLVSARTHAAIAGYSSGVPTLVLGYSVKARGMARDLYGGEEGHVLELRHMEHPDLLRRAFFVMREREGEERETLRRVLPELRERARSAAGLVGRLP